MILPLIIKCILYQCNEIAQNLHLTQIYDGRNKINVRLFWSATG